MAKCAYDTCPLPDNNSRFICQGVYIIVGVLVLLSNPQNFTYFQTMLFIVPVMIDIVCSGPNNRIALAVRWVIGIMDTVVLVICLLGLGGVIGQDSESYFFVESMLLFGGFKVSKNYIAGCLILNILIPTAYYNWSPCKEAEKVRAVVTAKKGVKS